MEYSIDYIDKKIAFWEQKRRELLEQIEESKIRENTTELLKKVSSIRSENAYLVSLQETSKTIPIIDNYCNSGKEFLVIKDFFKIDDYMLSPIITTCNKAIRIYRSAITMTDMKKMIRWYDSSRGFGLFYNKESREYPLVNCIFELLPITDDRVMQFKYPCQFNAQGSMNRTGYGNEYCGEDLVSRGTEYGETSTFYFIGVMIRTYNDYVRGISLFK